MGLAASIALMATGGFTLLATGWIVLHGVSARDAPTPAEESVARALRHLAIHSSDRQRRNPVPPGADALAEGMAHWADHCATCHGNDGRGNTEMGRNLYPKVPDMTLPKTQRLTDGELFAIIKNGVRLTGMPAWGSPGAEGDAQSWMLVHYIRHLRDLTPEELGHMKAMNPVSPMEKQAEREEDAFLNGGGDAKASSPKAEHPIHPANTRKEHP